MKNIKHSLLNSDFISLKRNNLLLCNNNGEVVADIREGVGVTLILLTQNQNGIIWCHMQYKDCAPPPPKFCSDSISHNKILSYGDTFRQSLTAWDVWIHPFLPVHSVLLSEYCCNSNEIRAHAG